VAGLSFLAGAVGVFAFAQGEKAKPLFPAEARWTLPLNGSLRTAPGFLNARAYVPLDEDRLEAYDLVDSKRLWDASVRAQSRPAVGDGYVFIAETATIVALREADGAPAWRQPLAEPLGVPLLSDSGWLVAVSESGMVTAYRATDGHTVWQQSVQSPASSSPALAGAHVYVPTKDGRLVALQMDTGHPAWASRLTGVPDEVLALDERVYVGAADKLFYCIRTDNGQVAWRWRTGGDVIGLPVVDERLVYFVSLDNVLRGLDRQTGSQHWFAGLPLRPNRGPMRVAGALIVSGNSPTLRAYGLRNGAPAGDLQAPGNLAAPPHFLTSEGALILVVVTRDIASGAKITAFNIEE
jgi:outer membrane protein assembly factor BamB